MQYRGMSSFECTINNNIIGWKYVRVRIDICFQNLCVSQPISPCPFSTKYVKIYLISSKTPNSCSTTRGCASKSYRARCLCAISSRFGPRARRCSAWRPVTCFRRHSGYGHRSRSVSSRHTCGKCCSTSPWWPCAENSSNPFGVNCKCSCSLSLST